MPFHIPPAYFFNYLLKREANQFLTGMAIRSLALGMVLIFEPIYLYFYFEKSLPLTLLFFAAMHGIYGLLAVFGGRVMGKIGLKKTILLSHPFFWGYYLCLFFISHSFFIVPLAIIMRALGMTFFWPAFHTDFVRFSEKSYQGREVGRMNVALLAPTVVSPFIGGWVLTIFNYHVLFFVVLLLLFVSAIPLLLSKDVHQAYTDSFRSAWQRIFKKANRKISLAFAADTAEVGINFYLWPVFMAVLAISYSQMGGIVSLALVGSALFTLYMGRVSDRIVNRLEFLNIGAFLTAMAWVIKYFVKTPFDALLAHLLYRVCRTSASIPFQVLMYEKAFLKGKEADEFIIYREILVNLFRCFFFIFLAVLFFFVPQVNIAFLIAALLSFGLTFLGNPPKIKFRDLFNINLLWKNTT